MYSSAGLLGFVLAFVLSIQFLPSASSEEKTKELVELGQKLIKGLVNKEEGENPSTQPISPIASPPNTPSDTNNSPPLTGPDLALPPSEIPEEELTPPVASPPNTPSDTNNSPPLTGPDLALPPSEIPEGLESKKTPLIEEGSLEESVDKNVIQEQTEADFSTQNRYEDNALNKTLLEIREFMSPYFYDPEINSLDPFEDPTIIQNIGSSGRIVFKTPLEERDLSSIRLKGIIWDIKEPRALFQLDGENNYYTLSRGDKIGRNGVIFEIREDEVVVLEVLIQRGVKSEESVQSIKILRLDRLNL